MSDIIKHECGIVLIRLLKPLDYYRQKYGSARYALNKLHLLMEIPDLFLCIQVDILDVWRAELLNFFKSKTKLAKILKEYIFHVYQG